MNAFLLAAADTPAGFDWSTLITPGFTLLGTLAGLAISNWFATTRELRTASATRQHELTMQQLSRQLEADTAHADRRLEAYTTLIAEITGQPERNERKIAEARERGESGGLLYATEISTALARAQLLSTGTEAQALEKAVNDFTRSYSEDVGTATRAIVAIYRGERAPVVDGPQPPIATT
ncbi:hypothetical protein [Microbacterium gorillae]|uniref:hypothetical protein n=1 Tax=Microbacterium gorillae TaxID=1231063 RepID=UPI00058BDB8E|nr:hypothetical protein [Microbacterium gorillae]